MSLSTTSTTAYTLSKYSRSYPPPGAKQVNEEWQHYINPTIRLVLDMKKSASGTIESYRCRVLWSLSAGNDGTNVEQNVVPFEDLELLAFSSQEIIPNQKQVFAVHGLPLKAVYRDTIVGIRYLHPRVIPPGASPTYRRFQITFETISDASKFVDAIRPVCPCKANPPSTTSAAATTLPARSSTMTFATSTNPGPSTNSAPPSRGTMPPPPLRPAMTMQLPAPHRARAQNINDTAPGPAWPPPRADSEQSNASHRPPAALSRSATSYVPQSSVPGHGALRADRSIASTAHNAPTTAVRYSAAVPHGSSASGTLAETTLQMDTQPMDLYSWDDQHTLTGPDIPSAAPQLTRSSELSTFGQPNSSALPIPTMALSNADVLAQSRSALLAPLSETPALYGLSGAELERLVAQIVREEGFVKLMQNLDSLWKVKVLIGMPQPAAAPAGEP